MQTNDLFKVETLQDWQHATASQVIIDDGGGASNSNSSNNSADEP